jgi:hypothetical protein
MIRYYVKIVKTKLLRIFLDFSSTLVGLKVLDRGVQ